MSKTIDILNMKGEKVGDYEIADQYLEFEKGTQAVHDAVVSFLSGIRTGTASTKTRAEVSGSGKKPFKQKGLGRARSGSHRNSSWRHGGIAFGPKPRSFAVSVNAKVRKLALKRSFSDHAFASGVTVVDPFAFESKKTKAAVEAFKAMKVADSKILCIVKDYEDNMLCALGNIPTVCLCTAQNVNTYQMLWADKVLMAKDALDDFFKRIE